MEIKKMEPCERNYSFKQSQQISMQTGLVGHLRADFGSGNEFFSSWEDFRSDLKTQEFKDEFDVVINTLRKSDNILSNRTNLAKYCYSHQESSYENGNKDFGVRVNTEDYAYLMRLNPQKGMYNLYCYCYKKDWLDRHIEQAKRGIRFIDSSYNTLFRIADGDSIVVIGQNGVEYHAICRYIDDYHVEVGDSLLHICEFAERIERTKATVKPEKEKKN